MVLISRDGGITPSVAGGGVVFSRRIRISPHGSNCRADVPVRIRSRWCKVTGITDSIQPGFPNDMPTVISIYGRLIPLGTNATGKGQRIMFCLYGTTNEPPLDESTAESLA